MINLSITSIEMVCWIARLGSFTAAAERLHTTQPAISARVRELEDRLGKQLFVRKGRGVELTIEGREFVERAEPLLRQIEDLAVSVSKSGAGGTIRIGISSICLDLFAEVAVRLRRVMPRVVFDVRMDRASKLFDDIGGRKLDVALVSGPVEAHRFASKRLGFDRMLWATSPGIAERYASVGLAAMFAEVPLWCLTRDSFYWSNAVAILLSHDIEVDRFNEINNTLAASRIVQCGGGIGLLSETMIRDELDRGTLVAIAGVAPCDEVEFSVICQKDLGGSAVISEIMVLAADLSQFRSTPSRGLSPGARVGGQAPVATPAALSR